MPPKFETLVASVFEDICVPDLIVGFCKDRESYLVKFGFISFEKIKLGPQRIMVKSLMQADRLF